MFSGCCTCVMFTAETWLFSINTFTDENTKLRWRLLIITVCVWFSFSCLNSLDARLINRMFLSSDWLFLCIDFLIDVLINTDKKIDRLSCLIDWLIDWLTHWLTDWTTVWWIWLIDWSIDWSINRSIDWLIDWLIWLTDWPIDYLIDDICCLYFSPATQTRYRTPMPRY